jgi:hypothetical protein
MTLVVEGVIDGRAAKGKVSGIFNALAPSFPAKALTVQRSNKQKKDDY